MTKLSVAIIGCGSRGCETYGRLVYDKKDLFEIVALCDIKKERLDKYMKEFDVKEENTFLDEESFFAKKRADVLFVCVLDKDHVRIALKALELGYHLLLEKPITSNLAECYQLLEAKRKSQKEVIVCHVLRYAPAFLKVAELIEQKTIGSLVHIQALEQVGWFHQAHSFVRGNWRNLDNSEPMIMAKCCHDLDLLQFYAKSRCKSISSIGNLAYFKPENKPQNSGDRCTNCPLLNTCPYSAKIIYIDSWKMRGMPENTWPYNVITDQIPLTEEALMDAIKTGPYGRCVFACDNNVVDNQVAIMEFENGVKASLSMIGFTGDIGRIMKFYGTDGEIDLDEEKHVIEIKRFARPKEIIDIDSLAKQDNMAHGGGDYMLIENLYDAIVNHHAKTTLETSIESHLMAIYAEKSRLDGGKPYDIHKD